MSQERNLLILESYQNFVVKDIGDKGLKAVIHEEYNKSVFIRIRSVASSASQVERKISTRPREGGKKMHGGTRSYDNRGMIFFRHP